MSPLVVVRPSAVRGGYGRQSQLVPRGTESPSATIDQLLEAVVVTAEVEAEVDVVDADRDAEHAVASAQSAIKPAIARTDRHSAMARSLWPPVPGSGVPNRLQAQVFASDPVCSREDRERRRTVEHLDECRQDVVVAAQEEREAHRALIAGRGPLDRDWSPEETAAYRVRVDRWQSASRSLVEALDRLVAVQRRLAVPHTLHDDSPADP